VGAYSIGLGAKVKGRDWMLGSGWVGANGRRVSWVWGGMGEGRNAGGSGVVKIGPYGLRGGEVTGT